MGPLKEWYRLLTTEQPLLSVRLFSYSNRKAAVTTPILHFLWHFYHWSTFSSWSNPMLPTHSQCRPGCLKGHCVWRGVYASHKTKQQPRAMPSVALSRSPTLVNVLRLDLVFLFGLRNFSLLVYMTRCPILNSRKHCRLGEAHVVVKPYYLWMKNKESFTNANCEG